MGRTFLLVFLVSAALSSADEDFLCNKSNCSVRHLIPTDHLDFKLPSELPNSNINLNFMGIGLPEQLFVRKENEHSDSTDNQEIVNQADKNEQPQDLFVVRIRETIMLPINDNGETVQEDSIFPESQIADMFNKMFEEAGIVDLSGKNMTGDELASELSRHPVPVTGLIMSNTRVHGLTPDSFRPVENSLMILKMNNATVSLQALNQLNNLRVLNLSHNGLSTFEWFPQMTDTLETLDLSHNRFKEVRPELSILTSLKELYLSHNQISSVEKNPLALLPSLEKLSLTMNSLDHAYLADLYNLQEADLDWNYLRLFGEDLVLPAHRHSVLLASNPWRCDCGILEARDSYDVDDLNMLQCANHGGYAVCNDCKRYFLPMENGLPVSNLTVDSIEHLGCTGLTDYWYQMNHALGQMKDREPEKLVRLVLLVTTLVLLLVAAALMARQACRRKKFNRRTWLNDQQIPYLKIDKLTKPQEVPYIKMDNDIKI